jgi:selenide,water dikinase
MVKTLVLAGGGHSHALFLMMWKKNPLPGVRAVLVSDVSHAPYSGMLPGLIAGLYSFDEAHIDLRLLCAQLNVEFILATVVGVDKKNKQLMLKDHPNVSFDVLSLNIGSRPFEIQLPKDATVKGLNPTKVPATPIKPIQTFLPDWKSVEELSKNKPDLCIQIVGGGIGSIEFALNARRALGDRAQISILTQDSKLLISKADKIQKALSQELVKKQVKVVTGVKVTAATRESVAVADGREFFADWTFVVTTPSPHEWLSKSQLPLDESGFLSVEPTMQMRGYDFIFAAGDTASIKDSPRDRSGVYAVRHAKPLFENIKRYFHGQNLLKFTAQKNYLSLIGNGDQSAILIWGPWVLSGKWNWCLKDYIDRKFMKQFEMKSERGMSSLSGEDDLVAKSEMRCLGCAAKVNSDSLRNVLRRAQKNDSSFESNASSDDAAEIDFKNGNVIFQSVDYMPAMLSDPYTFARIATLHAMSDIFAMGAKAHSALLTAVVPFADPKIVEEKLFHIISGVAFELNKMPAQLMGGHSAEGAQLAVGLTVNGIAGERTLRKTGARAGDVLILTKPVGVGVLFASEMRGVVKGRWIDAAIESMLVSNQLASEILVKHNASSCTDVTGFGIVGHLQEMLEDTQLSAQLDLDAIPILSGALECFSIGMKSSLHDSNQSAMNEWTGTFVGDSTRMPVLFDPQTSGGLLSFVSSNVAADCVSDLKRAGYANAAVIGKLC